jgi:hypothetical protein
VLPILTANNPADFPFADAKLVGERKKRLPASFIEAPNFDRLGLCDFRGRNLFAAGGGAVTVTVVCVVLSGSPAKVPTLIVQNVPVAMSHLLMRQAWPIERLKDQSPDTTSHLL